MRELIVLLMLATGALLSSGIQGSAANAGQRRFHDTAADGTRNRAASPASLRQPQVIGTDDRQRVADTTRFPYSAVAYLELEDIDGEPIGSCTGTFIGPDSLLTAGHCLWDTTTGDWLADHIRVIPGKDDDFEPFGWEMAGDWWVPDAYAETGSVDWDWGLLKMPNDALTVDTGWLGLAVLDQASLESDGLHPTITGYPADKPLGTMWAASRPKFRAVADFRLFYDIDTGAGQSGAAIWLDSEGPLFGRVVGIHAQGGTLNSGSRIDQELLDDVLEGCRVMECTIAIDASAPATPPGPPHVPVDLPFHSYGVALARD
jgi:glutamyl endopeptidase